MAGTKILNSGPLPEAKPDLDIAAYLRSSINSLKGEFYDLERGRVDYGAMRDSEAFRHYSASSGSLREFDLSSLTNRADRLAFWINLYNTLVVHGIIELGIRESVKEVSGFFGRFGYVIGGMTFTPNDIEHGILRGNRRPYFGLLRPFSSRDPRMLHSIDPPDSRIHFTLVCGSASCPPINFYTPEQIDQQLDIAAAGFINSSEVEILPEKSILRLSNIFRWYGADFGGQKGVVDILVRYLDHGDARDFLLAAGEKVKIQWKPYDWQLNH